MIDTLIAWSDWLGGIADWLVEVCVRAWEFWYAVATSPVTAIAIIVGFAAALIFAGLHLATDAVIEHDLNRER